MENKSLPKYFSISHHLPNDALTVDFVKKLRPQQVIELVRLNPVSYQTAKELIKYLIVTPQKEAKFRTPQIIALVRCFPEILTITAKIAHEYQNAVADPSQVHAAFINMVSAFLEGIDAYHRIKLEGIKLELFTCYSLFTDTIKADLTKGIPPNEIEQIEEVKKLTLEAPSSLLTSSMKTLVRDMIGLMNQRRMEDVFYLLSKDVNFAYSILVKYAKAHNIETQPIAT